MKKFIVRTAIVMGVLLLMLIAIGLLLPSNYRVVRSTVIDADAMEIYNQVARLRTWADWTTWTTEEYPTLKYSYEGPDSGVGAVQSWTDEEMGGGRLEVTSATVGKSIAYEMRFDGYDEPMLGEFTFESTDDGTTVTWIAHGELGFNPISRYFGTMFDSMIGADFQQGLDNLKERMETREQAAIGPEPTEDDVPELPTEREGNTER